jgi:hypothetical protein
MMESNGMEGGLITPPALIRAGPLMRVTSFAECMAALAELQGLPALVRAPA